MTHIVRIMFLNRNSEKKLARVATGNAWIRMATLGTEYQLPCTWCWWRGAIIHPPPPLFRKRMRKVAACCPQLVFAPSPNQEEATSNILFPLKKKREEGEQLREFPEQGSKKNVNGLPKNEAKEGGWLLAFFLLLLAKEGRKWGVRHTSKFFLRRRRKPGVRSLPTGRGFFFREMIVCVI